MRGRYLRLALLALVVIAASCGVLLARSGAAPFVSRAIPVGASAFRVLVDPRSGHAFVGDSARLQMIDMASGVLLRTIKLGAAPFGIPVTMALDEQSERVFLLAQANGSHGDTVSALDARGGRLIHRTSIRGGGANADQIAVDTRTSRAYVLVPASPTTLRVTLFDAVTGHLLRTVLIARLPARQRPNPGSGQDTLSVDQRTGYVVVAELDSTRLHALDGASGRVLWTTVLDHPPILDGRPIIMSPLIDDQTGRIVVGDYRTGAVSTLDAVSGRLVHRFSVPPGGLDMVAIRRSRRVFVFHGGRVSVMDATNGRSLRTGVIGHAYEYGPAVVDQRSGHVFLASTIRAKVVMLDGASGRILHVAHVGPNPVLPVIDEHDNRALVTMLGPINAGRMATESIAILDGSSGALLHTMPTALGFGAIGVDERTGRVAILNNGGATPMPDSWAWVPGGIRRLLPFIPPPPSPSYASVTVRDIAR